MDVPGPARRRFAEGGLPPAHLVVLGWLGLALRGVHDEARGEEGEVGPSRLCFSNELCDGMLVPDSFAGPALPCTVKDSVVVEAAQRAGRPRPKAKPLGLRVRHYRPADDGAKGAFKRVRGESLRP